MRQESDDLSVGFAEPTSDGELEYCKQVYRTEFKEAFADAMRSLSPRDRNLLRYAIVDGLSVRYLLESARSTLRDRLGPGRAAQRPADPAEPAGLERAPSPGRPS